MAPGKGWFNLEAAQDQLQLEPEPDPAFEFLQLTRIQRFYCFGACMAIGFVLSLLGSILLILGQTWTFALLYTVGIVVTLVGTGFLIGFFRQLKMMFAMVRIVATIIFLASIVLVFIAAFVIGSQVMAIILVIVEYLAYTWYCLSYIPYARQLVKNAIGF
ncbi:SFT2-domain-containing protein [Calocera viscosa TUFC12733]|uniref:Protein transport protein SFT2 n=1 Tax=Calocera viscosa (strain TUFC12733) TaxID=1330018 RepID=A0A167Q1P6_CALVF|nr:SFT2-domain-containing protein [Calocera viscosa TUFC12733]